MEHILIIHTVLSRAFVGLVKDGDLKDSLSNEDQKSHGVFLHVAIDELLKRNNLPPSALMALGVTTGPGSYTGIRVGLAAAKGFAFALQLPVVPVSTLELLARTAIDNQPFGGIFMPLLHARLSEYYAGWYDENGNALMADSVIDINNFTVDSLDRTVHFFGPDVSPELIPRIRFEYSNVPDVSEASFAKLIYEKYHAGQFQSASTVAPSYLKAAYTTHSKSA